MENKCNCYKILATPKEKIIIHLMGCEEDYLTKEYDSLKWYQKLFRTNPRRYLEEHYKNLD